MFCTSGTTGNSGKQLKIDIYVKTKRKDRLSPLATTTLLTLKSKPAILQ